MKILFVDTGISGHHQPYLKTLLQGCACPAGVVLPERIPSLNAEQFVIDADLKSLRGYRQWLKKIAAIQREKNYDRIHFLYGDIFYRFFGLGLGRFKPDKVIVTFHHLRYGFWHEISLKAIFKRITLGIVHANYLLQKLAALQINNCQKIEYPVFEKQSSKSKTELLALRQSLKIPPDVPVLLALGGTRSDKGLDILLTALTQVKKDFHLLIAGQAETFGRDYIEAKSASYQDQVSLQLNYLPSSEMTAYLALSDIVVLPYRKIFDGASGPLGLGVVSGKCIIGPDHGSLGETITQNDLGQTFVAEDSESLATAIERALSEKFVCDRQYRNYQEQLNPSNFVAAYQKVYRRI
ncbi:glycosyltransferase family 4 protein [Lactobacillus sp. DCY120]|uniref:Glycosyltransferase family 4 protein n=1 Tax=Bombilactobacillus apium TaxID=2675299 RepID=A0A850QWL5_9LACO|nr:glycosyltransferase family 4 protein [Bombilactobacillus apium]NVY96194.1 glycosyltransferase family 4 protein [Bombilactobacillus apium]